MKLLSSVFKSRRWKYVYQLFCGWLWNIRCDSWLICVSTCACVLCVCVYGWYGSNLRTSIHYRSIEELTTELPFFVTGHSRQLKSARKMVESRNTQYSKRICVAKTSSPPPCYFELCAIMLLVVTLITTSLVRQVPRGISHCNRFHYANSVTRLGKIHLFVFFIFALLVFTYSFWPCVRSFVIY